eukprot:g1237.t1
MDSTKTTTAATKLREPLLESKKEERERRAPQGDTVKISVAADPSRKKSAKENGKKKDKQKPKKKEVPWYKNPRESRTIKLAIGLFGSYYLAATSTCKDPYDWIPKMFTCQESDPSSWNDINSDGRPLCTDHCSPMTLSLILGMFFTNAALVVFWWVGEILIAKFDAEIKAELKGGREWQKELDKQEIEHGLVPATERRKLPIRHSAAWNEELLGWQERKEKSKKEFSDKLWMRAYFFYVFFFGLSWMNQWLVLVIMPTNHSYADTDLWGYLRQQIEGTVTPSLDGFYSYIIWTQFLLEFVLFMVAAMSITWPRPSLIRQDDLHRQAPVAKIKMPNRPAEILAQDESLGLIQDTCLLIACHRSVLSKDRFDTFSNTLRAALAIFPANAVFVCDNAPDLNPCDRTQEVCKQVSLEKYPDGSQQVNYLYIPEGNKSHAMYYTTEYWIPHLVRHNKVPDFKYCMMIDDDVPLPPDLHVPLFTLRRNKDIKAFCYVICAATESGEENFLVSLQDAEYKFAGFTKQFQYRMGTTLCCHGAIALWRRDILGKQILWHHDTEFHGEDQYMGLLLHRMQRNYVIGVSAGAVVPTFAPETLLVLFRQRVTSWDLCAQRKIFTIVKMFCSGWCNFRTLILKPYMLQEVINVVLDWVRLYLLVGLAQRNFVGLCLCFICFYALLYVEICVFNYGVLRKRPDLQMSVKTILAFPFYRTLCLFFRMYALMRNILMYSTWRPKKLKISYREENQHDLPPVPLTTDPDWATVWHTNTDERDEGSTPKISAFTERLMRYVRMKEHDPIELRRNRYLIQAAALTLKLQNENRRLGFPLAGRSGIKDDVQVIVNALSEFRGTILRHMRTLVSSQHNSRFESKLHEHVDAWDASGPHLFYSPDMPCAVERDGDLSSRFAACNIHVLKQVEQLLFQTKYPSTHDRVKGLKTQVRNIIGSLEYHCHTDRARGARDKALTTLLDEVAAVKEITNGRVVSKLTAAASKLESVESRARSLPLTRHWRSEISKIVSEEREKIRLLLERRGSVRAASKDDDDGEEQGRIGNSSGGSGSESESREKSASSSNTSSPPKTRKKRKLLNLRCPKNAVPGKRIRVRLPDGTLVTVRLPDDAEPGKTIKRQKLIESQNNGADNFAASPLRGGKKIVFCGHTGANEVVVEDEADDDDDDDDSADPKQMDPKVRLLLLDRTRGETDEEEVVIVRGSCGASGLGLATAKRLVREGANVAIADRDEEKGMEECKNLGPRAMFVEIDATNEESVKQGIAKTVAHFGGLHGAINCAGTGSASLTVDKKLRTHNTGVFDFVMKLNLYGVFYSSAHAAVAMAKGEPDEDNQRGVIINVSSVAGIEGQKGQLAYSASKGGVIGMTLPMARDLARFGIRVMTICPGIMDTPMMQMAGEKVRNGLLRQVVEPKRFGKADEFAQLCCQIIDNHYLNGTFIRMDGGIRFANL